MNDPTVVGKRLRQKVSIECFYEDALKKQKDEVEKLKQLENLIISDDQDFQKITGLKTEEIRYLKKFRPKNVQECLSIPELSQNAVLILQRYLSRT